MRPLIVPLSAPEAVDPDRFGPKAANLAALGQAGLPIPGGFCLDAEAYRMQLAYLGLEETALTAGTSTDRGLALKASIDIKLGLFDREIAPAILEPLLSAWREMINPPEVLGVVRSSSLSEDTAGSSFAGQFESFLGLDNDTDFLTAVRSCWAALWSTRAVRYMETHGMIPADTAMGLLIQPLVAAKASGGGLSRTVEGEMLLSATWGLGSAIAQGEVVPDRYVLNREGALLHTVAGRKTHSVGCSHGAEGGTRAIEAEQAAEPCLNKTQAEELGQMLLRAEQVQGVAAEIEWAMDDQGIKMLQARPLNIGESQLPDKVWLNHTGLSGHPAGVGWSQGRACVVNCECELGRVGHGDVLVTKIAGPALSAVLPRVAGVVAELGGSTSHIASLARERGIPMVLGVLDATLLIPDGVQVAVDGVAGRVHWER